MMNSRNNHANNSLALQQQIAESSAQLAQENANLMNKFVQEYVMQGNVLRPNIKVKAYPDGSEYRGETSKGKKTGTGIYRFSGGEVYFGQWRDDQFHGQGVYIDRDGERYEGNYSNGRRQGSGNFHSRDGVVYKGEWNSDKREGRAVVKYPNGGKQSC